MRNPVLRSLSLALVASALLSCSAIASTTLKEPFDKSYPLAAGGTFTLRNVNGAVTLEAWDRNEVRVEAEKQVKAGSDAEAKKIMAQVRIDVQAAASGVRVDTKLPKHDSGPLEWLGGKEYNVNVTYHIHLPRNAVVDAGNTNGHIDLTGTHGKASLETTNGHISVTSVEGDLTLGSTNGAIEAKGVAGRVKAETTNGHIEVQLTRLPHDGDLTLETTNGGVTVKLPKDARLSVDAETSNGRIHSDFEVAGGQSGKHRLEGAINGGGGRLRVRTMNGSVHLVQG